MSIIFTMKPIKPKTALSSASVRARILNALKEEGKAMKATLENDVTGTWKHDPGFSEPHVQYRGGDALVAVVTDDPIFRYLDEGTVVRWVTMTRDFIPKTRTSGSLRSGPGAGDVVRRKDGKPWLGMPHRGIEARNFTERVGKKHGPLLAQKIRDAIAKGMSTP